MVQSILLTRLTRDLWNTKYQVIILTFILGLGGGVWFSALSITEWGYSNLDRFHDDYNLDDGVFYFPNEQGVNQSDLEQALLDYPSINDILSWDVRYRYSLSLEFNGSDGLNVPKSYLYGLPEKSFEDKSSLDRLYVCEGRDLSSFDI